MGRKSGDKIGSSYCHGLGGNQVFAYTKRSQIMSDDNCLDSSSANGPVNLVRCHGMQGNQEWIYDDDVSILVDFLIQLLPAISFEAELSINQNIIQNKSN